MWKKVAYVGRGLNVSSRISLDTKRLETLLLRTEETKGKQYKLGRVELQMECQIGLIQETPTKTHFLRSNNLLHLPLTILLSPLDLYSIQTLQFTIIIDNKPLGGHAVLPWVVTKVSLNFGVSVVGTEGAVEHGPRVVRCAALWRFRKELKVDNGFGTVSHRSADTVVPCWFGSVKVYTIDSFYATYQYHHHQ